GAKYVVLTSKHHEGYSLYPSKYNWNWNSQDVGPNRDLVGELAAAVRSNSSLTFGLYHSLFEFFNPFWIEDRDTNFTTRNYPDKRPMPMLKELVEKYKPDYIYSDGDGINGTTSSYWNSTKFLAWLFNDSPVKDTVVDNDRWGEDCRCIHGSTKTCHDRYNPGYALPYKWENAMTFDRRSWGYRRNADLSMYLSIEEVLKSLVTTVSCGGNMLINFGPSKEGTIPTIMEERMRQMGTWLGINGEGIYASSTWKHQNDTLTEDIWYTMKGEDVYAFTLSWPYENQLTLGAVASTSTTTITMLGYNGDNLQFRETTDGLVISMPWMSRVTSKWVWTLKMTNVKVA
ncbi:unnamed protein product, partial [Meganyctiphanes norvegica]